METIADIGSLIEITPHDEIWIKTCEEETIYIDDRTPFRFRVRGHILDGQVFYGLYGPVDSGPERYLGLTCNITLRLDGSDWRHEHMSGANFKVGPAIITRNHSFDFRHPDGTVLQGYPVIGRYGHVRVIEEPI